MQQLYVEPQPGDTFLAYRILSKLGKGGMGSVFLAERIQGDFERKVAIKFISPGAGSEINLKRFVLEQQILGKLQHPNISRILDAGITDIGIPFYIMEFVDGIPLMTYCIAHSLTIQERVTLFQQVIDAVSFAHQNLIVHRDLKPENILITKQGKVKLIDFGIAKLLYDEADIDSQITTEGLSVATLVYAAPEQIQMRDITTATDVYALGLILYHLLSGRFPYKIMGSSPFELMNEILNTEPASIHTILKTRHETTVVPPVRRSIFGDHQQHISKELDAICLKALRKQPEKRYPTVVKMGDDLNRFLKGKPVHARQQSFFFKLGKWILLHKSSTLFVMMIIGFLSSFSIISTMHAKKLKQEKEKAITLSNFFMDVFSDVTPEEVRHKAISAKKLLLSQFNTVSKDDAYSPEEKLMLYNELIHIFLFWSDSEAALPIIDAYQNTATQLYGDNSFEISRSHYFKSTCYTFQGKYDDAMKETELSLAFYNEPAHKESYMFDLMSTRLQKALLLVEKGKWKTAKSILKQLQAYWLKQDEGTREDSLIDIFNALSTIAWQDGKFKEAIALSHKALDLLKKKKTPPVSDLARTYNNLGTILKEVGKYREAEQYLLKALEMNEKTFGRDSLVVIGTLNNLGGVYRKLNRPEEAEKNYLELLELAKQILPADHPWIYGTKNNLALLYTNLGTNLDQAETYYRETLAFFKRVLGEKHPNVGITCVNLGRLLREKGQYNESLQLIQESIAIFAEIFDKWTPTMLQAQLSLGQTYAKMSKNTMAIATYEKILSRCPPPGPDSTQPFNIAVFSSWCSLGDLYHKNYHNNEKALDYYQQCEKLMKTTQLDLELRIMYLVGLASIKCEQGNKEDAMKLLEEAQSLNERDSKSLRHQDRIKTEISSCNGED
jgi:serine/threonine-protein kinase